MSSLAGRTALVTGAARRIGRAVALGLAAERVESLLLHYNRSAADVAETAEQCRRLGVRAELLPADLAEPDGALALGREAAARGADVLVHNASTFTRLPFLESDVALHRETLARDLRLHVEVPYLLGRVVGERMVESGFGRIVVIGDWSADAAVYRGYAPYIVSKAAVPTLVRVLALELGARSPGVTANAVLPGPILAPEGHDAADAEMVKRQTILGRWVGPEEVVRAVIYLLSSPGVTGAALRVDGGRSVKAL